MTKFTVAQIRSLARVVEGFEDNHEINVTQSYRVGTLKVYIGRIKIRIYSNGNWSMEYLNGKQIAKGKYRGKENET